VLYILLAQAEVPKEFVYWEHLTDKYGLPTAFLAIVLTFLALTVRYLRDKVATPLVVSHNKLCENLGKNNDENTATLKQVGVNLQAISTKQDQTLEAVHVTGQEMTAAIKEQTSQLLGILKPSSNGDGHTHSEKE